MLETLRKLAAVAALAALLLPGLSAVAQTLSAGDLPACCNTAYCPVHHRQGRNLQKDKSNCNATGNARQDACSMRACDAAPNPIAGASAFLLAAPVVLRVPATVETAPVPVSESFAYVVTIPLTPPPRTLWN